MTNNQLAENSVIQLLNSVKLARDNAERADNRVDHSFYYALTIALEELQERRKAAMDSEPVELPLDYLHGHKDGLEWAAQLAEANHPETGDWLYDDPIELAKAIRKGPDMPPVQPVADSEPVFTLEVAREDYKGQKLGNHFGFTILDAARKLEEGNYQLYTAQPAPEYPETLPCPVLLKWKRQFGPFEKCPVCYGLLSSCQLCSGNGKVIQEDIDAWNNPIAQMRRELNHG